MPAAGAVQIDLACTGTQTYVSMRLCKKALQDWRVVDNGSSAAGRFSLPGSSVSDLKSGEHDRQVDDEDDVYMVEQFDAARQHKYYWEYRMIWNGYLDPI
eukprot:1972190-Pleurochrysis_carterae.AAC.2